MQTNQHIESPREQLRQIIIKHAVRVGDFHMASGGRSNILIDLSGALRGAQAQRLIEVCTPKELHELNCDRIGGPVCGSDLVAAPLSRAGVAEHWLGVRKEIKGRGLDRGTVTGELAPGDKILCF